jgi:GxxExxY protein
MAEKIFEDVIDFIHRVEKVLGKHYKENIYQNALYYELNTNGYISQTEVIVPILYKNFPIGFERADIVIYKEGAPVFIIELKSQNQRLGNKENQQLRKYMTNLNCKDGILVNFYETLEIVKISGDLCQKI